MANRYSRARLLGQLAIFGSAFFIYLSTLVIRWSQRSVDLDPAFFVFARFLLGFIWVCGVLTVSRRRLAVHNYHFLFGRAIANCTAVYCFYKAVTLSTVAEANILNMTFPLFVALFSWVLLRKQRDFTATLMVGVAFFGVWLVLAPEMSTFKIGNMWGLASGLTAAVAILYLNLSRRDHDTLTVLFFMFGSGAVIIFTIYFHRLFMPGRAEIFYLLLCAAFGVAGQYLLTLGFRYVTAVEGSIVASARILMAAILGPYLAYDPPLTAAGWTGAVLILGANIYLAMRRIST